MGPLYEKLAQNLQRKGIPLETYQNYLNLSETPGIQQITTALRRHQIDLNQFKDYLEKREETQAEPASKVSPTASVLLEKLQHLGNQLLHHQNITLEELNRFLEVQETSSFSNRVLLQHLLKLRKIKIEQFVAFEQEQWPPLDEKPYLCDWNGKCFRFRPAQLGKGTLFGHYQLMDELGRGGMGVVYKAYHTHLQQVFALKVMLAGENASERMLARFHREVQTLARLKHPGIIQIVDSGQEGGRHYFAMEYVEGTTLEALLQKAEITIRELLAFFQNALESLHYAHSQGVVHRDLKPANIFVTKEGVPKIADFGLAKDLSEDALKLTQTGTVLGTANYMSPEQARGEIQKIDARTDVYAMGVTLYYSLTKTFPHQSESFTVLLQKIIHEEPIPPSFFSPSVHPDLDTIILKALNKSRSQRYRNALQFSEDLKRFLEGYPILAKAPTSQERLWKWAKRHRHFVLFLGVLFFLGISFVGYFSWQNYQERSSQIQTLYQEALQYQEQMKEVQGDSFQSKGFQFQYLLNALHHLNRALQFAPETFFLEQKKWEIGQKLIALANENDAYRLAQYVSMELKNLKFYTEAQKEELVQQIQQARLKKSKREENTLKRWMQKLNKTFPTKLVQNEAIFEISYCKEPQSFERLLGCLQEATQYFFDSTQPKFHQDEVHFTLVTALGRQGNPKAGPFLLQSLEKIFEQHSQWHPTQQPMEKVRFMIILTQALANCRAINASKTVGKIRWEMGENGIFWEQTKRYYRQLAHRDGLETQQPQDAETFFERAHFRYLDKNLGAALQDINQMLQLQPRNFEAYVLRGIIKEALEDYEGAILDQTHAISLNPRLSNAYVNRGTVYLKLEEYEKANQDFTQAIRVNPYAAEAYMNRGNAKFDLEDYIGALEDFDRTIQIKPQFEMAYINRSLAKDKLNDLQGAYQDVTIAIQLNPNSFDAYLNRGSFSFKMGDGTAALKDFEAAVMLNPQNQDAYLNRGMVKQALGDLAGAVNDYSEALKVFPRADILYSRGMLLKMMGQKKSAQEDFIEYLELTKESTDPRVKIIRVWLQKDLEKKEK